MLTAMDIITAQGFSIDILRKLASVSACEDTRIPRMVTKRDSGKFRTVVDTDGGPITILLPGTRLASRTKRLSTRPLTPSTSKVKGLATRANLVWLSPGCS